MEISGTTEYINVIEEPDIIYTVIKTLKKNKKEGYDISQYEEEYFSLYKMKLEYRLKGLKLLNNILKNF